MCRSSICLCSARLWPCQDFSSQALTRGVSNKFDFDIFISRLVRGLSCMHLIKVSSIHDHSHFSKCTFMLQVELNHSRVGPVRVVGDMDRHASELQCGNETLSLRISCTADHHLLISVSKTHQSPLLFEIPT